MVAISFIAFLLLFVCVGVLSFSKKKTTSQDYLLASQNIKPWLVALSAVATNNSGYMFIGQIGFTYMYGLHSIWLMIGWVVGDFFTSTFVHKRLREVSEERKVMSFASLISEWHGHNYKKLRVLCGLITVMFLGTYAAAQLNAGSKALHIMFDWDYSVGAIIGSIIVLSYCFAGGIRASIWTDAAQSFVMFAAMAIMVFIGISTVGGFGPFMDSLNNVSPKYMDLFPDTTLFGSNAVASILFVMGWFFAGIGVIGQPHIMIRFMTIDDADKIWKARSYYYGFYIAFYALTIITALAARLLLPEVDAFDAELALPALAQELLPEILVGLVLAGLFAATMSTADSQILSCTAALTNDLFPQKLSGYKTNKFATVFITALALMIALFGSKSVFSLVLIAWSALASAFAPILILHALNRDTTENQAIAMVVGGIGSMLAWRHFGLNDITYEIVAGITGGFVIYLVYGVLLKITGHNGNKVKA
ncbi:MAG: sodium/proline symporter [Alphaproteobacteria bacterium]|nr:sodium/proline symporter [Alphaproteobacteria bacterium]